MTKLTKGFILGVFTGIIVMFTILCAFGWWYNINHPTEIEEIVVDSFPFYVANQIIGSFFSIV